MDWMCNANDILHLNPTAMKNEYKLEVALKTLNDEQVFAESYKMPLLDNFVKNVNPKEHGFKNHVE